MTTEPFSKRLGHAEEQANKITIRNDAPQHVRDALLSLAELGLGLDPSFIRDVLCKVLKKLPDRRNWSEYPNIHNECEYLITNCQWYKVYDFVEALYEDLWTSSLSAKPETWEKLVNDYFVEAEVGWRLVEGRLESRGEEGFKSAVDAVREALKAASLPTAHGEIHEALRDLSRRPEPDLTGAIQHGMAALECTARVYAEDPKATLGDILKKHPGVVPKPLDEALSQIWGYASEMARHIREGRTPEHAEAELVVGVAAVACTYLAAKIQKEK